MTNGDFKVAYCGFIVAILVFLGGCEATSDEANPPELVRPVKYFVVGQELAAETRQYPGRVVASQEVNLAFQVAGQLIEKTVKKGQRVAQNDILAKLDPRDFQLKLDEATAMLHQTASDFERAKSLLQSNTISQSQFEAKQAAFEVAKAQKETAGKALNDTVLIAPFAGIIANTFVDNYQNVQAKQDILSLQDISHVDIDVQLPEQDLLFASRKREEVDKVIKYITFDSLPNRRFYVDLSSFSAEADPVTNTYKITLTMQAPDDLNVLPGMSATFYYQRPSASQTELTIPVAAMATDENGQHYVWLIDKDNMVQKRTVQISRFYQDNVGIREGLTIGDRVVVAGIYAMQENTKVRLWAEQD